jgi:YHS domain-containing protein
LPWDTTPNVRNQPFICVLTPVIEKTDSSIYSQASEWYELKRMKNRRLLLTLLVLLALSILAFGQGKNLRRRSETVRDPVCGLMVENYYFCTKRDRDEFKKNPQKYVPPGK